MELYVGINTATMDIILISDKRERIEEEIKKYPQRTVVTASKSVQQVMFLSPQDSQRTYPTLMNSSV